ncbi:MAG: hypothetical protein SGI77_10245, partial [Pirellulaceae bacterium]|nr:hypothetical protein [Pirellulaceae bacterium]
MKFILITLVLVLAPLNTVRAADAPKVSDFKSRLQTTLNRHLSQLVNNDGSVASMKGKTAAGEEALSFYLMFEATGDQKFRDAAIGLADEVLKKMRATKFGVLPIKEKALPQNLWGKINYLSLRIENRSFNGHPFRIG